MEYGTLKQLKYAIEKFSEKLTDSVEEIHREKKSMQRIYEAVNMAADKVRYVRDDDMLILSSPNIIIGNVDKFGRLLPGNGQVTVRGYDICNEAADKTGSITNRATTIRNIAVDPGIDGLEEVVYPGSRIINQAKVVTLQSNDDKEAFSHELVATSGILLSSDTNISLHANADGTSHKQAIEGKVSSCKAASERGSSAANKAKEALIKIVDDMEKLLIAQEKYNSSVEALAVDYEELYGDKQEEFHRLEQQLYGQMQIFLNAVGQKLEGKRCTKVLDTQKGKIKDGDALKKQPTGTAISLQSEAFNITSTDGDGNYRENKEACLTVNVPHVTVNAADKLGNQIKDGSITLMAQDVTVDTSTSDYKAQDKDMPKRTKSTAAGSFKVESQHVSFTGKDKTYKDDGSVDKKVLNTESKFNVQAEKVRFKAIDKDGKASGSFRTRFKDTTLAALDANNDSAVAKDSNIQLYAQDVFVGSFDKENGEIYILSKTATIDAGTQILLNQVGKASLNLNGGKAEMGGSSVAITGKTTMGSDTEFSGKVAAKVIETGDLSCKSNIKSPNISDGMGVPTMTAPANFKGENVSDKKKSLADTAKKANEEEKNE